MKKLLLTLLLSTAFVNAQEKLIIEYDIKTEFDEEKKREFEIEQAKKGRGGFSVQSPKQMYQLEYNENEAYYNKIETVNNAQGAGGSSFSVHIGGEHKGLINDISSKSFKQEITMDNENYIAVYPYKAYDWKITAEESKVLNYKVIKAISEKEKVIAWFAPDLKIDAGPKQINGLPGLILKAEHHLDSKMGTILIYEAYKVTENPKKFPKRKPFTGKEVNQEELKKLQEESRKKMIENLASEIDFKK